MNRLELTVNHLLPNAHLWANRQEKDRFVKAMKRFSKENPKAKLEHESLFMSFWWLETLERRLQSQAVFFDGTPTSYQRTDSSNPHSFDMDGGDIDRKNRELDKYMFAVQKQKLEYIKTALASSITLAVTGSSQSITELIRAARNIEGKDNGCRGTGCTET